MSATVEAISLLLSLTQAASQLMSAAGEVGSIIERARSEGRELTDAELEAARMLAKGSRDRLAAME